MNLAKFALLVAACSGSLLTLPAQSWSQLETTYAIQNSTGSRMVYDSYLRFPLLFGGKIGPQVYSNAQYVWTGNGWSDLYMYGTIPARAWHGMAFDEVRQETVIFGGSTSSGSVLGDTWTLKGAVATARTSASTPAARTGPAMAWDPGSRRVILFGGSSPAGDFTDTWAWNGTAWTQLPILTQPTAQQHPSMAFDYDSGQMILFGGAPRFETWAFDGSSWRDRSLSAGWIDDPSAQIVQHDTKVLLVGRGTWLWSGTKWLPLIAATPFDASTATLGYNLLTNRTLAAAGTANYAFTLGTTCAFSSTNSTPVTVTGAASSQTVSVPAPAGCPWTAASDTPGVTFSASSGTGPTQLTVNLPQNPGPIGRLVYVRVGGTLIYAFSQLPPPCPTAGTPLPTGPIYLRNDCSGTTFTYTAAVGDKVALRSIGNIGSDGAKTSQATIRLTGPAASSAVPVLSVVPNGNEPVALLPAGGLYTFLYAGTWTITIDLTGGAAGYSQIDWMKPSPSVDCTTTAQPYDVDGPTAQPKLIPAAGGRSLIHASMNPSCFSPFIPVSLFAQWLSPAQGLLYPGFNRVAADAAVNFGVERNVGAAIGYSIVTIAQAANVCTDSLTQTTLAAGSGRTAGSLPFTSDCAWKASSSAPWLQVYPLEGIGTVPVRYTVFPNFTSKARTAAITIGGRTFTVTQDAGTGTELERYVSLLYFNFFGRLPSRAELDFQTKSGLSREQLALNFFNSQEFALGGRFVAGLYVGILNRDAEYGGWLFQRDALTSGITDQNTVVDNFLNSSEFKLRYLTLSDISFVSLMYTQILRRGASYDEALWQANNIAAGLSRAAFTRNLLNSAEFNFGSTPRLTAVLLTATLLQRDPTQAEYNGALTKTAQIQAISDSTTRQNATRDQLLAPIVNGTEMADLLK